MTTSTESFPRILIVGCGFPQLSLIRLARGIGLYVVGADLNPKAVGVRDCHQFAQVSTADVDGLVALFQTARCAAITTTGSEVSLRATAAVAARLGLPFHADPETIRRCQEKDRMRAAYATGGVSVPPFAGCASFEEAETFAKSIGFPVVVKPARGWGQRGVTRVDSPGEFPGAFDAARAHAESAGLPTVVVEAWLEGGEYSVNGWIEDGTLVSYCVTERITVPGKAPLGVMLAEVAPSGLSAADEALVIEEARRGARALGLTRGPCYSQVALSRDGERPRAFLFETAARMGGGFDADVTRLVSGVDLYKRILGIALGNSAWEAAGAEGPKYGAALSRFLIGDPGRVVDVRGIEDARKVSGVIELDALVSVGGVVHPLTDSSKRAAYALVTADTRDAAMSRAERALQTVQIITERIRGDEP
jgi:biotin carboxylase